MNDTVTLRDLAKMIDHSLLHPTMTDADVRKGCELARRALTEDWQIAGQMLTFPAANPEWAAGRFRVCPEYRLTLSTTRS
jgi:deoxyribose-phosphate aldolase